jgi:hypothetical protein
MAVSPNNLLVVLSVSLFLPQGLARHFRVERRDLIFGRGGLQPHYRHKLAQPVMVATQPVFQIRQMKPFKRR